MQKIAVLSFINANGDFIVDVVDSFYTDLTDSNNALIKDASDAAKLKVEDQEIWVPKKEYFMEGSDGFYELKEQKLEEFLGVIHGLEMKGISGKSNERLPVLGVYFQAKFVLQYCGDYFRTASRARFPRQEDSPRESLRFALYCGQYHQQGID
ncbi:hypothetical protein L596_013149 [Steinernema carpocapsae]|uniref:Uncharacterized protein n=1 Tax=Steinernema carpocapsae TaxID=34508 RepID=A0A4U5P059_STECR|nr:hypothetical protein L596_013149 [Steinernema carpocapsae]